VGNANPAIIRSSVVLPHPEGPSRKNKLPDGIVTFTRSTAVVSAFPVGAGNRFVMLSIAIVTTPEW